jgi:formylglycine-generating enzyme required for sulfatase activity
MTTRAQPWLLLLLAVAGCAGDEASLALTRPETLRGLEGVAVQAVVEVYREASACAGEPDSSLQLEERDGEFVGTLHLRPRAYFFCVRFASGAIALGLYEDLPLEVQQGSDKDLALDPARFRYRHLDDDGDGIANLDEVRFGFDLDAADADSAERVSFAFGGSFQMGASDAAATVVERPAHAQPMQPFAIDRLEVSVERYRRCVARAQDPCAPPRGEDLFTFMSRSAEAQRLPITGVALEDARRFCTLVAGGALPREEQWEYAARSTGSLYPWGDQAPEAAQSRCAWINARYPAGSTTYPCHGTSAPQLVAVDHFDETENWQGCGLPALGLPGQRPCQQAGNAWEWTDSRFMPYPGATWSPPSDELYVVRGGSADSLDHSLRATFRVGVAPDLSGSEALAPLIGFRCAY